MKYEKKPKKLFSIYKLPKSLHKPSLTFNLIDSNLFKH